MKPEELRSIYLKAVAEQEQRQKDKIENEMPNVYIKLMSIAKKGRSSTYLSSLADFFDLDQHLLSARLRSEGFKVVVRGDNDVILF